jgi:hypothetical protein
MATITTRVQGDSPKGSPLTNAEVDNNFINLNTAKYESGDNASFTNLTTSGVITLNTTSDISIYGTDGNNDSVYLNFGANDVLGVTTNNRASIKYISSGNNTGSLELHAKKDAGGLSNQIGIYGNAGVVINEGDASHVDFRVESDSKTHMLFVDSSANAVGINNTAPTWPLELSATASLGSSLYDYQKLARFHGFNGNQSYLDIIQLREDTSTIDWSSAATRIQQVIDSTEQGYIQFNGLNRLYTVSIGSGGSSSGYQYSVENVLFTNGGTVFNQDSLAGIDFRVESDGNANMLFVDAGNDAVCIGTNTQAENRNLTVSQGMAFSRTSTYNQNWTLNITHANTNEYGSLYIQPGSTTQTTAGFVVQDNLLNNRMQVYGSGSSEYGTVFNQDSADIDFRVESDSNEHAFFLNAGQSSIGINTPQTHSSRSLNVKGAVGVQEVSGFRWTVSNVTSVGGNGRQVIGSGFLAAGARVGDQVTISGTSNATNTITGVTDTVITCSVNWTQSFAGVSVVGYSGYDLRAGEGEKRAIGISASGAVTVNPGDLDVDFTVKSPTSAHFMYLNAGNNRVGINNSDPKEALDVYGEITSTNFSRRWTSYVVKDTWSRILQHTGNGVEGGGYLVRLSGTRGNVVFNMLAEVSYGHSVQGHITLLNAARYSPFELRLVVESYGSGYLEFKDKGQDQPGYTNQSIHVSVIHTSEYTGITPKSTTSGQSESGETIPSGYYERGLTKVNSDTHFKVGSLESTSNGVIINQDSNDQDFRVETDNNSYALFVDAGNNVVTFGQSTGPQATYPGYIQVRNSGSEATQSGGGIEFVASAVNNGYGHKLSSYDNTGGDIPLILHRRNNSAAWTKQMTFEGNSSHVTAHAGMVVNEDSYDSDFRVESDSNSAALFVDASENIVEVNAALHVTSSPNPIAFTYRSEDDTANAYNILSTDNHANFCVGNNVAIGDSEHGLYTPNLHSTIRGSAMVLGGNSYADGSNTINFYISNDPIAAAGDAYTKRRILSMSYNAATINEDSNNVDFRVESDSNSNMFHVDASAGDVTIGNLKNNAAWKTTDGVRMIGYGHGTSGYMEIVRTTSSDGSANVYMARSEYTNGRMFSFCTASAEVGSIRVNSSSTRYLTTSDRRLKDNIETITDGTAKVMAMNPVTHTWIADPDAPAVHGFIAQEIQEVIPESVSGTPDGEEMMSMDYGRITPVLVAALQDAHKKIAELEARLNTLEGK